MTAAERRAKQHAEMREAFELGLNEHVHHALKTTSRFLRADYAYRAGFLAAMKYAVESSKRVTEES